MEYLGKTMLFFPLLPVFLFSVLGEKTLQLRFRLTVVAWLEQSAQSQTRSASFTASPITFSVTDKTLSASLREFSIRFSRCRQTWMIWVNIYSHEDHFLLRHTSAIARTYPHTHAFTPLFTNAWWFSMVQQNGGDCFIDPCSCAVNVEVCIPCGDHLASAQQKLLCHAPEDLWTTGRHNDT